MSKTEEEIIEALKANERLQKRKRKEPIAKRAIYPLLGFDSDLHSITLDKSIRIVKTTKAFREKLYGIHDTTKEFFCSKNIIDYEYVIVYNFEEVPNIYPGEAIMRRDLLLSFFRIFSFDSIDIRNIRNYYFIETHDEYESVGISCINRKNYNLYSSEYYLNRENLKEFKNLWQKLLIVTKKRLSLKTAFKRFNYSFERIDREDKIVDLFICLESLFLNQESELSYRLSLRVSKFLEPEFDPEYSYSIMKKMDGLRSKIVHGAGLQSKDLKYLNQGQNIDITLYVLYNMLQLAFKKCLFLKPELDMIETIDRNILTK